VWQRYPGKYSAKTPMASGRDFFVNEPAPGVQGKDRRAGCAAVRGSAFLDVLSGTTGKPRARNTASRGIWPTSPPRQVAFWTFIRRRLLVHGGHRGSPGIRTSCTVPGEPGTSVLYEGVPTFPERGALGHRRALGREHFPTAPTAIRMLRKLGPQEPRNTSTVQVHDHLGEPSSRRVALVLRRGRTSRKPSSPIRVADRNWRLSLHHVSGAAPDEAGSSVRGAGIHPVIYDETARSPQGFRQAGNICIAIPAGHHADDLGATRRYIKRTSQGTTRIQEQGLARLALHVRYGALQAADGIPHLGRIDDVINVAGHRLARKSLESAASRSRKSLRPRRPVADELKGACRRSYIAVKRACPRARRKRPRRQGDRRRHRKMARPKRVLSCRTCRRRAPEDHAPRARGDLESQRCRGRHALRTRLVEQTARWCKQGRRATREELPEDIAKFRGGGVEDWGDG